MTQEQLTNLAKTLNITLEAAQKMVDQEVARKAAGERYRKSDAYKQRLALQKLVRAELAKLA